MNQTVSKTVDSWIAEEELPVRANLKVILRNDPNYGLTEDEIQDRVEFIRCYLLREFELLMMIPKQTQEDDFFVGDFTVVVFESKLPSVPETEPITTIAILIYFHAINFWFD